MNSRSHSSAKDWSKTWNIRTLLVDDSPFMLKVLAQILAHEGNFTLVGAATDGCQALRRVLALSPDLVLMDFYLPHLNGIQATRYIKQFENPPIVIIITSDESPTSRSRAKDAGADAFVVKGEDIHAQLRNTLQELFGSRGGGGKRSAGIGPAGCLGDSNQIENSAHEIVHT